VISKINEKRYIKAVPVVVSRNNLENYNSLQREYNI
jgi:hypothetical protein